MRAERVMDGMSMSRTRLGEAAEAEGLEAWLKQQSAVMKATCPSLLSSSSESSESESSSLSSVGSSSRPERIVIDAMFDLGRVTEELMTVDECDAEFFRLLS